MDCSQIGCSVIKVEEYLPHENIQQILIIHFFGYCWTFSWLHVYIIMVYIVYLGNQIQFVVVHLIQQQDLILVHHDYTYKYINIG